MSALVDPIFRAKKCTEHSAQLNLFIFTFDDFFKTFDMDQLGKIRQLSC